MVDRGEEYPSSRRYAIVAVAELVVIVAIAAAVVVVFDRVTPSEGAIVVAVAWLVGLVVLFGDRLLVAFRDLGSADADTEDPD